jgi:predicted dithiol-disulfide oxidoreductase (DUF899 family)
MTAASLPHLFELRARQRGGDRRLHYLDITPKGRNEKEIMDWMRRHDEYEDAERSDSCCASETSVNAA